MPAGGGARWGSYRLPLLDTPFFLNAAQFDSFEIDYETDNYSPATQQQNDFVDSFQTATLALFAQLPADTAIFSSTCLVHCLSEQATFYNFYVDGVNQQTALTEWFFGGKTVRQVSSCKGWDCTNNCGLTGPDAQNPGLPCNVGSPDCETFSPVTESADAALGDNQPAGPSHQTDPGTAALDTNPNPPGSSGGGGGGGGTDPFGINIWAPGAQLTPAEQQQKQKARPARRRGLRGPRRARAAPVVRCSEPSPPGVQEEQQLEANQAENDDETTPAVGAGAVPGLSAAQGAKLADFVAAQQRQQPAGAPPAGAGGRRSLSSCATCGNDLLALRRAALPGAGVAAATA